MTCNCNDDQSNSPHSLRLFVMATQTIMSMSNPNLVSVKCPHFLTGHRLVQLIDWSTVMKTGQQAPPISALVVAEKAGTWRPCSIAMVIEWPSTDAVNSAVFTCLRCHQTALGPSRHQLSY